jgi:hypothetical protein
MKKNSTPAAAPAQATTFKARVVYGFLERLEVILLGNPIEGKIEKGMHAHVKIGALANEGNWEIIEIQRMDFINDADNHNFMGLVLRCLNEKDFNLLKSLRVYDEIILVD